MGRPHEAHHPQQLSGPPSEIHHSLEIIGLTANFARTRTIINDNGADFVHGRQTNELECELKDF